MNPLAWTRVILISLSLLLPMFSHAATTIQPNNILIFGDSLSAAYGIPQTSGWVTLLQNRLIEKKLKYQVINASVSGETTIGGVNRLEEQLKRTDPKIVMIELGANDGLRGLPINEMQKNLSTMIKRSQKSGAKVILIGMKLPPNYGPKYTDEFSQRYQTLSQEFKISLVPFMLDKIATDPTLMQDDGLHPNEKGQILILENIWPILAPLLKK